MWVRPLAKSDATCGGKAANLARLIAAGLPVPDGFVIEGQLEDRDEVNARASALGKLAVRSSASVEDGADRSGAGVFASATDVDPRDVWDAVRAVWESATTPLATLYARGQPMSIAVIVQRFVPGDRITVYTRPPGKPADASIVVQRGEHVRVYQREDVDPIVTLALRAEHAIGAQAGADVELVEESNGTLWVVQARVIVHPPPPARVEPPPALLAALVDSGLRWTWDVTHNPDPLSPAQAWLVERVERAQIAPWSMRVVAGYLYTTPRVPPRGATRDAAAIEVQFAKILDGATSLDDAITRYLAFYELWSNEMVPLIAANRPTSHEHRPSSVQATLLAAARGTIDEATALARLAPFSPAWDVAVPTFGEQLHVVKSAITRARTLQIVDPPTSSAPSVADLAERDDYWFARAQQLVRDALLRSADERGIDREDICWLSLDDLDISVEESRRKASAAKAANARAARWAMPLAINGDTNDDAQRLQGFGSGARISGRVVRFASLASAVVVGRGDIIVTRAITPALAVFVVGCAAIISETGGPLDHGAAIARELGIPFIVGCKDAWSLLHDGMLVTIAEDVVFPTRK